MRQPGCNKCRRSFTYLTKGFAAGAAENQERECRGVRHFVIVFAADPVSLDRREGEAHD
jgi:hypothetical protein